VDGMNVESDAVLESARPPSDSHSERNPDLWILLDINTTMVSRLSILIPVIAVVNYGAGTRSTNVKSFVIKGLVGPVERPSLTRSAVTVAGLFFNHPYPAVLNPRRVGSSVNDGRVVVIHKSLIIAMKMTRTAQSVLFLLPSLACVERRR
jgi:hypothetical protein